MLAARLTLALAFVLASVACDSMDSGPTADELDGFWVNVDDGTIRAYDFSGTVRTYVLYVYDDGANPGRPNQSGTYEISKSRLVTNVDDALDASAINQSFVQDISGFDGARFTLESLPHGTGSRLFTRADALP